MRYCSYRIAFVILQYESNTDLLSQNILHILNQSTSLEIPIVRETGGLRDTVRDCGGENGNGFTFKTYNAHDMFDACMRAKARLSKL